MIITNSRYALVGYFITPTRAHGIIVKYHVLRLQISTCEIQSPSQFVRYFTRLLLLALVPSASRHSSVSFHFLSLAGRLAIIHGIVQYCFVSFPYRSLAFARSFPHVLLYSLPFSLRALCSKDKLRSCKIEKNRFSQTLPE